MDWYSWLALILFWTIIVATISFAAGMVYEKDKIADDEIQGKLVTNEILTPNEIRFEPAPIGLTGATGLTGPEGPPGEPGPPGPGPENWQVNDHQTLPEWCQYIEGRITRVEKKAGMSV